MPQDPANTAARDAPAASRAASRLRQEWLLPAALLLFPALALAQLQAELTNTAPNLAGLNAAYYDGTMGPIFDARLLMRLVVRGTEALLPLSLGHAHVLWQAATLWGGLLCCLGAARRLGALPAQALLAPLVAVAWLPWTFLRTGHHASFPYDFPALLFAAGALWAFIARRHAAHVALVLVGTLSKETIVWLAAAPLALALLERGAWKRHFAWGIVACAAFAAAYLAARLPMGAWWTASLEAPIDGAAPRPRLSTNFEELLLGGMSGPLQNAWLAWAPLLAGLACWRRLPLEARAAYLALPVFLGPILLAGNVNELRLYNDVLPLGAVVVALLLAAGANSNRESLLTARF